MVLKFRNNVALIVTFSFKFYTEGNYFSELVYGENIDGIHFLNLFAISQLPFFSPTQDTHSEYLLYVLRH